MTSTILLSQLHIPDAETPIPLPTLQSVLSHHLSTTSSFAVTQLTATAISSPFFHPRSRAFEYAKVQAFETAFRHAVHLLKQQRSKKDGANYINLSRWTRDAVRGIQGGHPILRLAACGGILLGVEDLKNNASANDNGKASIKFSQTLVESETVVALAEVLDSITVHTEWEDEFQSQGQGQRSGQHATQDMLLLAFILASHSLPLVDSQRLNALPLNTLARLLTGTLVSFFDPSHSNLKSRSNPDMDKDISHVPSLAKLTSIIFAALLDSTSRPYIRTLTTVSDTFNTLLDLSRTIEQTYQADPSNQIPKQFLFTTLMISQSVLSSIVYIPPHLLTHPDSTITLSSLALITLQTLTHLSLPISKFGGITKAFEQLQKAFYLSIDILLSPSRQKDQNQKGKRKRREDVEAYVKQLSQFLQSQSPETAMTLPFRAKLSFALSTFEQLIPALSPDCVINHIWSVCYSYLTNASDSNREIYESAHSVVLSVFVHDSQRRQELDSMSLLDSYDNEEEVLWTRFIERLVLFYAKCLVEDTTLTIPQLRHASASVVQCATALSMFSERTFGATPPSNASAATALPWYCVQLILDTTDALSSATLSESLPVASLPPLPPLSRKDRLHRLHLMLVSTLPSLPLELLERCLKRVRDVFVAYSDELACTSEEEREKDEVRRKELVQALFELFLSEQMSGDAKEVGVKWWYENLELVRGRKDWPKEGQGMLQSRL